MTAVRYEVDAVVDRSGRIGRYIDIEDGAATVPGSGTPNIQPIRRPGFIVPGLHDAHLHLGSISAATSGVTLADAIDLAQIAGRLSAHGTGDVVAIGFDESDMTEPRLPTTADLDPMVPDRALLVYRVCGHIAIANSIALERAGISAETHDPIGGSIDRAIDGRPTGVLRETAIDLVSGVIDDRRRQVGTGELASTIANLERLGLTSVTAMIPAGAPAWCGPDDELDRLLDIGMTSLRIDAVLISGTVADLRRHARRLTGSAIRFAGWKGFADGSLGGHTAALRAPYADRPGGSGTMRLEPDRFGDLAEAALELGGSACIHAIGDDAVSGVLDLYRDLIAAGAPASRLRVEHASVLDPGLIERMAGLGVVASVQPAFVVSDARWLDSRLGPERARWAYPFRSMLGSGVTLIGGSDAPVERPDPLAGARAAVARSGWNLDEALEPWQAVSLFADGSFGRSAMWVAPDLDDFERLT